ncbi:MAG TPA: hypothetical protein VFJ19_20675 [Nocardioidaceae bacterium]|nr:hypothetical protein [Nocardioidaceae bacterium]
MTGSADLPDAFARLVDDAAIFPPGNAPLPEAVVAHRRHEAAAYADLVGPFVVADNRLADLLALVEAEGADPGQPPLPLSVVVTGGAGAIAPAVRWATRSDALALRFLEIRLREDDAGALAHNAQRIVAGVDAVRADAEGGLPEEAPVYVEMPRSRSGDPSASWLEALDVLAVAGLRAKFRTGGVDADAFPDAAELAACIAAALDREVPFKCTAGLHNALRHRDEATGFEHHGFLNVLLATRASLDGASREEAAAVLDDPDPLPETEPADLGGWASARRWFTSFGSCSVAEPLTDLIALGLLPETLVEPVGTGVSTGSTSVTVEENP